MYKYSREEETVFVFKTKNEILYRVFFKSSPYLFNDETLAYANDLYEFIIEAYPLSNNTKIVYDVNVSTTIADIINLFYREKAKTICIYICDSNDNRQLIRHRKFSDWFYKYSPPGISKTDYMIVDEAGNEFPISLILNLKNPYFNEIIEKFISIAKSYSK